MPVLINDRLVEVDHLVIYCGEIVVESHNNKLFNGSAIQRGEAP